jgi:hypothetical protein
MKKFNTSEGIRRGWKPAEVDAEVSSIYDIERPGVYAVDGIDYPIDARSVTSDTHEDLAERGEDFVNGLWVVGFGMFVEEKKDEEI